jgi:hypothetical protein
MTDTRKAFERAPRPRAGITDEEIRAVAAGFAPQVKLEIARALAPIEQRLDDLEGQLQAALKRRAL